MPPRGTIALYEKAVGTHSRAYRRALWDDAKYKRKIGHMLQRLFGKSVWTLKDLVDFELEEVIKLSEKKLNKIRR